MNTLYSDMNMMSQKAHVNIAKVNSNAKLLRCSDENSIEIAATHLKCGHVIALPTDTVYGLACDANDIKSIQRLYEIKERDEEKPVAVCVPNITQLKHYSLAAHLPDTLLTSLLPGAVTIVLYKSRYLSNPLLNNGIAKIGLRIPDDQFIQNVCAKFNAPIALTSANRSGACSTLNVHEFNNLWKELGVVFDGGHLGGAPNDMKQRCGSTVIDLSEPGTYQIIRDGSAKENTINVMKQFNIENCL